MRLDWIRASSSLLASLDVASTILAFAGEYAIKIIVVGKSRRPWYKRLGGSILDRLERHAEGLDILIADI